MNPLLLVDSYKLHHNKMYPDGMTKLYSNFTPRKSRIKGIDSVVVFGIQHFIKTYLIDKFNKDFFSKQWPELEEEYKRHTGVSDILHIKDLWDYGRLPLEIKALPEGTLCPIGVPMLTITNTHPNFGWLVNYLETLLSCCLWQPITSATIAYKFKQILSKYAMETTGSTEGVQWQGHDFSMRGMSSPESAITSSMGHLLSFTGTDSVPAIYQLEDSYDGKGLIGASVPATEHSVMCMGTKESEIETFARLLDIYPTGILSVVSDTWDLWKVCTEFLPALKDQILAREGKLVIRPDSGDPVDILCGNGIFMSCNHPQGYGVVELLWNTFGGTINEQGYKVLDPHIGAIYGDSINLERAEQICERLKAKGFASTNVVLGVGSYTYQYNTRDTFGFAMKATYGEITHEELICSDKQTKASECKHSMCNNDPKFCSADFGQATNYIESREIFKDPITDDGTKRSAKGLLKVYEDSLDTGKSVLKLKDQCSWEEENQSLLRTVFKNGYMFNQTNLQEIRERLNK